MINRGAKVTLTRQTEVLALSRLSVHYRPPRVLWDRDLGLIPGLDELHLQWRFMDPANSTGSFKRRVTR
jgi:hypothetical protein